MSAGFHPVRAALRFSLPRRMIGYVAAFAALTVLTGLGVLADIDRWGRAVSDSLSFFFVDLLGSVLSILGNMETTGILALLLAVRWGRRYGWRRSLAPLLLFAGVAVEIILKFALIHPPPPPLVFQMRWQLPFAWLSLTHALPASVGLPYSFPSGHLLRTTFLVSLVTDGLGLRYRLAGAALIITMAFTRVYLNDHWLSDVVGGCLLGYALAVLALAIRPVACRSP